MRNDAKAASSSAKKEKKERSRKKSQDGPQGPLRLEFMEDIIPDDCLPAALKNCYSVFHMLHGRIWDLLRDRADAQGKASAGAVAVNYPTALPPAKRLYFHDLMADFAAPWLQTIDATLLRTGFRNSLFYTTFRGFQYGPVERQTYLSVTAGVIAQFREYLREGSASWGVGGDKSVRPVVARKTQQGPAIADATAHTQRDNSGLRASLLLYQSHLIHHTGFETPDLGTLYLYLVSSYNGQVHSDKLNCEPWGRGTAVEGLESADLDADSMSRYSISPFARSHYLQYSVKPQSGHAADASPDADPDPDLPDPAGLRGRYLFGLGPRPGPATSASAAAASTGTGAGTRTKEPGASRRGGASAAVPYSRSDGYTGHSGHAGGSGWEGSVSGCVLAHVKAERSRRVRMPSLKRSSERKCKRGGVDEEKVPPVATHSKRHIWAARSFS